MYSILLKYVNIDILAMYHSSFKSMLIPQYYNCTAFEMGMKFKDMKNLLCILKRAEIARLTWQIQFDMQCVFIVSAEFA